jgi:hypothetical protein
MFLCQATDRLERKKYKILDGGQSMRVDNFTCKASYSFGQAVLSYSFSDPEHKITSVVLREDGHEIDRIYVPGYEAHKTSGTFLVKRDEGKHYYVVEAKNICNSVATSDPIEVDYAFDLIGWVKNGRKSRWSGNIGEDYYSLTATPGKEYGAILTVRHGKGKDAQIEAFEFYPNGDKQCRKLVPMKGFWTDYQAKQEWQNCSFEEIQQSLLKHTRAIGEHLFENERQPSMFYPFSKDPLAELKGRRVKHR